MSSIKRYIVVAFCAMAPLFSTSQVSFQQFQDQPDLNLKSELGLELWNYYLRTDLDSLKIAAIDLLLVASKEKHEFARAVGTRMLGSYLYRSGSIKQGLEYLNMSKGFFEKQEDYVVASEVWNEIGHAYQLDGALNKAKDAYNKSLRFGEQSTDATASFNAQLGLGRNYILSGDTTTGMKVWHAYKQSSLVAEKYEAAADVYAFMAMIESERGDKALADEYYKRSISFGKRSTSKSYIANSYANQGIRKFGQGDFDSSLYYFERSLQLRLELKNKRQILEGYYNLGFFFHERNSIDRSIEFFELGKTLAERHELWTDLHDFLNELIPIYTETNQIALVDVCEKRKEEVEKILEQKRSSEDVTMNGIDLDFTGKVNEKSKESEKKESVNWMLFVIIVVAVLILLFLFLERRRIN